MFNYAFVLVLGAYLLGYALYAAVSSFWRLSGWRAPLGFLGGLVFAYGGAAFYGLFLSPIIRLPPGTAWPMGRADQVIQIADGRRIAVNTAASRIQIYDREWNFIRGWVVNAGGGTFKVQVRPEGTLEVRTARGSSRYVFNLEGGELESGASPHSEFAGFPATGGPGYVPTPRWLMPFSSPIIAWIVAAIGMIFLACIDPKRFPWRRKRPFNPSWAIPRFVAILAPAWLLTICFPEAVSPPPSVKPASSAASPQSTSAVPILRPGGNAILKTQMQVATQYGAVTAQAGTRVHLVGEHDGKWTVECNAGRLEANAQDLTPVE